MTYIINRPCILMECYMLCIQVLWYKTIITIFPVTRPNMEICPSSSFSANIFLEIRRGLSWKEGFGHIGKNMNEVACHTATNIPGSYTEIKREPKHAKWLSQESHLVVGNWPLYGTPCRKNKALHYKGKPIFTIIPKESYFDSFFTVYFT